MHYEIAGSGLPIILLHGIGSNARSWRRQLAAFSAAYQVIAWDAPGFGKSEDLPAQVPSIREFADSLKGLMNSLGLESAVVLGHSLGGLIAQEFYRTYPQSVRALILADTTQGRSGNLEERLRMIRTMSPQQLARERAPKLLSKNAAPELVEEAVAIMSDVRRPGYEFAAIAMAKADMRGVLDNMQVPLLMIWGVEDQITPLWPAWPASARVELILNAGHLCYAEQPDVFNAAVLDFLRFSTPEA